jgi:hypothetical protein
MTITGAVGELNREIERLTKIRDSLLQGLPARNVNTIAETVPANASGTVAKNSSAKKKRVISAEARRKMSEASKARWAAAKKATAKKSK